MEKTYNNKAWLLVIPVFWFISSNIAHDGEEHVANEENDQLVDERHCSGWTKVKLTNRLLHKING